MSNKLPITVCTVDTPAGSKHYVTVLNSDEVFANGLPPEAIVGELLADWQPGAPIEPNVFARNKVFVEFLHGVIARHAPEQAGFQAEARRLGDGRVWVIDQRTPTPGGPVPPEDILGGFEVKGGVVVPGSYRQCPKHRVLSEHGFMKLDAGLLQALLDELRAGNPSD